MNPLILEVIMGFLIFFGAVSLSYNLAVFIIKIMDNNPQYMYIQFLRIFLLLNLVMGIGVTQISVYLKFLTINIPFVLIYLKLKYIDEIF
jgi:hypothetical protein